MKTILDNFRTSKSDKAKFNGGIKVKVIINNWLHQGFLYLDLTEKICRVFFELISFFVAYVILSFFGLDSSIILKCLLSFVIGHSFNWIFNDNFWTCLMFTFPSIKNPGNIKTINYLSKLQLRLRKHYCVSACLIFGSVSRGVWHDKSDLDVRILRRPGFLNGICCYFIVWFERVIAVFYRQPLDLYMVDRISFLDKMRNDEFPVFIKCDDHRLYDKYINVREIQFGHIINMNDLMKFN